MWMYWNVQEPFREHFLKKLEELQIYYEIDSDNPEEISILVKTEKQRLQVYNIEENFYAG